MVGVGADGADGADGEDDEEVEDEDAGDGEASEDGVGGVGIGSGGGVALLAADTEIGSTYRTICSSSPTFIHFNRSRVS